MVRWQRKLKLKRWGGICRSHLTQVHMHSAATPCVNATGPALASCLLHQCPLPLCRRPCLCVACVSFFSFFLSFFSLTICLCCLLSATTSTTPASSTPWFLCPCRVNALGLLLLYVFSYLLYFADNLNLPLTVTSIPGPRPCVLHFHPHSTHLTDPPLPHSTCTVSVRCIDLSLL